VLISTATPTPASADADNCSTVLERLREASAQSGRIDSDAIQRVSDEFTRCRQLSGWDECEAIRQRLWDQTGRSTQDEALAETALLGDRYRSCMEQLDRDPTMVYAGRTGQRVTRT
jgi:hypothetical protein